MGCNNMQGVSFSYWPEYNEVKKELDHVTNLLCKILRTTEANGWYKICEYNIEGLKQWWEEHKEYDKRSGR